MSLAIDLGEKFGPRIWNVSPGSRSAASGGTYQAWIMLLREDEELAAGCGGDFLGDEIMSIPFPLPRPLRLVAPRRRPFG